VGSSALTPPPSEAAVLDALRAVIDPELGDNVVDLGMVTSVSVDGGTVRVDVALTIAGCPLRTQLERDVTRMGGEGVVVKNMDMRIRERECPMQEHRRDHIAEVTIIGTATARFTRSHDRLGPGRGAGSLAILSLDPQRRQAARVRLGGPR